MMESGGMRAVSTSAQLALAINRRKRAMSSSSPPETPSPPSWPGPEGVKRIRSLPVEESSSLPPFSITPGLAFSMGSSGLINHKDEMELDPDRLKFRKKQVDIGKNTVGYKNYVENVPREKRQLFNPIHPMTPDVHEKISRRAFCGKIKVWRKNLHLWDVLAGEKLNQEQ